MENKRALKQGLAALTAAFILAMPSAANALPAVPGYKDQQTGMMTRFYYQAALQLAVNQNMDLATDLMGKVSHMNPQDFSLAVLYGQCLEYQGRTQDAIDYYQALLPTYNDKALQAILKYRVSMNYGNINMVNEAASNMENAISLYPGNPPAEFYFNLGVFYARLNEYEKTRIYSQKAVEVAPTSAEAWNNLGYSMTQLGQFQEGYDAIQKAMKLSPENANILDSMGFVLFKMGRFHESAVEYEKALQLDPAMPESMLYLGRSYDAMSKWSEASQAYEAYLKSGDNLPEKAGVEKRLVEIQKYMLPLQSSKFYQQLSSSAEKPVNSDDVAPLGK